MFKLNEKRREKQTTKQKSISRMIRTFQKIMQQIQMTHVIVSKLTYICRDILLIADQNST